MADFYDALDFLLESQVEKYDEAGQRPYHCDPDNPTHYAGGMLMGSIWGLTAQDYAIAEQRIPRREEIARLSIEEAAQIHHDMLWLAISGDKIKSQAMANCLMDAYHHIGSHAISILQCLCKCYGHQINITGLMNKQSLQALNMLTDHFEAAFYNRFNDARRQLLLYLFGRPMEAGWRACFQAWDVAVSHDMLSVPQLTLEGQLGRVGRAGAMLVEREKFRVLAPDMALVFGGVLAAVRVCVLVGVCLLCWG